MVLIVGNDVEINILNYNDKKVLYGISPYTIYLIGENSLKGKYILSLDESFDVYDIPSKKEYADRADNNIIPEQELIDYIKSLYPSKIFDTNEIHRILFIDLYSNQNTHKENRYIILPKKYKYEKRVDIKCY